MEVTDPSVEQTVGLTRISGRDDAWPATLLAVCALVPFLGAFVLGAGGWRTLGPMVAVAIVAWLSRQLRYVVEVRDDGLVHERTLLGRPLSRTKFPPGAKVELWAPFGRGDPVAVQIAWKRRVVLVGRRETAGAVFAALALAISRQPV